MGWSNIHFLTYDDGMLFVIYYNVAWALIAIIIFIYNFLCSVFEIRKKDLHSISSGLFLTEKATEEKQLIFLPEMVG